MTPAIIGAVLAIFAFMVSAVVNALSVMASNGVRAELKALRELFEAKYEALVDRVEKVEKFQDNFVNNKLAKGASHG